MRNIMIRFLPVVLIASVCAVAAGQMRNPPIVAGKYMTIRNGHLWYDGRRVRFWGVNFCSSVKRSGKDLDLSFDRLADLGVNGVRINLFGGCLTAGEKNVTYKVPVTVKGSGSQMDLLDRSVYLARQRGMFFWMSFENDDFKPGDYDLLPDDGTRDHWNQAIRNNGKPEVLVFLYPRAGKVFMEFAKNLLDHVNPYTRRRWADEETIALWEIFNENLFVRDFAFGNHWQRLPAFLQADVTRQWNEWLTKQYHDDAGLKRAWGELPTGESLAGKTVAYAPLYAKARQVEGPGYQPAFEYGDDENTIANYPYRRGEDVVRFAVFLYRDYVRKFTKFVRKQGKGIAVVPITPTGSFERSFTQFHSTSGGDFVSNGTYGFACRPWELNKNDPCYPFLPRVNGHPLMGQPVDIMYPSGKPYLLYECNDYRPNPYRVEFPLRIATMLIHQNADGAFWFNWDDAGYLANLKTDEDYVRSRMPMPDKHYPNAGLILANDEAMLAAVKGAGALFRDARLPAAKHPRTVVIGKDLLFNLSKPVMGELEWLLRRHAWREGIRLKFDPCGPSKLPPNVGDKDNTIHQGPYTTFSWGPRGSITVDAPRAKAHAGFNGRELQLGEVKIHNLNRDFTSIYIVAEDSLPLAESKSILITLSSEGTNTGFRLDPKAMKHKWAEGLAEAVVQPGSAPHVIRRVGCTITAPWMKGTSFTRHDFLRRTYQTGVVKDDSLVISPDEPLFYLRLTR